MAIPDAVAMRMPILQLLGDKNIHTLQETVEYAAKLFNVTEEEQKQLIPSGLKPTFKTRVTWVLSELRNAILLENIKKGVFKITERGLGVLKENPPRLDNIYLKKFPEFRIFLGLGDLEERSEKDKTEKEKLEAVLDMSPQETLEDSYQKLRRDCATDLLSQVKKCSWEFFEKLVVKLIVKMGYGGSEKDAGQAIGRARDGGIDGVIKEDLLGLDVIYIQAKKWDDTTVGRPEIQKFVGALQAKKARKGIFMTTSNFSKDAIEYVHQISDKVILIDGNRLTDLMIDKNVGVLTTNTYDVKKVDSDYFEEL